MVLVEDGLEIASGLRLVPTPGHTAGHAVHQLQLADPDLVYVSDHDPDLSATTRKEVLGRLADTGTAAIVSHFHGPGRFARRSEGFSWSSLAKEGETAVE